MIGVATRALVWARANGRCEYCRVHQDDVDLFTFHIEHVIPRKHGGSDDPANLCLSCPECNVAKGANLTGLLNDKLVPLVHPRRQNWNRHFSVAGSLVVGKSRVGVVTVDVLNLNDPARLVLRESLLDERRWPR